MVSAATKRLIGVGLYTPSEASYFSRLMTQTVNRWLFGDARFVPVLAPELDDDRIVTFLDFIQLHAIRRARREDIPLHRIRKAIDRARVDFDLDFPLARDHRLVLYDRELFIEFPGKDTYQLSGSQRGQMLIREIAEPFLKYVDFGDEGLAEKFTIFKSHSRPIVMHPNHQFGMPIVGNTGYRADVLFDSYKAEGSVQRAADAYGVKRPDIHASIEFYDYLDSVAS
ncbi:MAG: hypothetical protein IID30_12575 [Planctomycetes bacterium]|nr:hypothetical protein [Planctomycetota bacterium]